MSEPAAFLTIVDEIDLDAVELFVVSHSQDCEVDGRIIRARRRWHRRSLEDARALVDTLPIGGNLRNVAKIRTVPGFKLVEHYGPDLDD